MVAAAGVIGRKCSGHGDEPIRIGPPIIPVNVRSESARILAKRGELEIALLGNPEG